ncbi:MAG: hypothetical protein LBJ18_01335 [Rickettsiales bacterium]|jgi:hypothetical protein|nr:hypothetical protein [Rickettsiales bacterium]
MIKTVQKQIAERFAKTGKVLYRKIEFYKLESGMGILCRSLHHYDKTDIDKYKLSIGDEVNAKKIFPFVYRITGIRAR